MSTLREIQEQFARHLQGLPSTPDIAGQVKFNQLQNTQRLQVYQNNFKLSLVANLAAIFPVIKKLVGDDFFEFAAKKYIQSHPSRYGNLHEYGAEFWHFLATFEPAKSLRYLPDMAKLEWAYHRVFHEAEVRPLDLTRLSEFDENDYGRIVFYLNPATRLLKSNFPLVEIWKANQLEDPPEIKLHGEQSYYMLIVRRKLENKFHVVSELDYCFLQMIEARNPLGEILAALSTKFPEHDIDLNRLLIENVTLHHIYDFAMAELLSKRSV